MAPAQSYRLHPLCRCRGTSPSGGSKETRLPDGGAVEQSETEGVLFVEWHQPKVTDYTPFAAVAALPPAGAARRLGSPMGELSSKARLRGCCSLNGTSPKLPTTPPLPLPRHFPQRGQREGRGAPPPTGAARETRLPKGGSEEYNIFCNHCMRERSYGKKEWQISEPR